MALITPSIVREHVETDLGDAELQRLIDDADALMVWRYGAHAEAGDRTEYHTPGLGSVYIYTTSPAATITSVTEYAGGVNGETATVLASDDYALESGRQVRRKANGTHSGWGLDSTCWAPRVEIVYTPTGADNATRIRVMIDLVRLALAYTASNSESVGDLAVNSVDYNRERERLLRVLSPGITGFIA